MTSKAVKDGLKLALADTYALYLKTQNYHWNVTGVNFKSLHLLFEEQYTDLAAAIDDIAERIRTLGEKAPATFSAYNKMKTIEDGDEKAKSHDMVKHLSEDQAKIIETLTQVLREAQKAGDEVTVDMIIGRISVHEKNAWMLKSSL